MPQNLQTPRYDQLIRRVGGIIGPGSKVSEALGELFPVIDLENAPPELIALTGWRTAWQSTERPAQAAQNSVSQLFNPAGSGMLVVVTAVGMRSDSVNTIVQLQLQAATIGTNPVAGLFRDARFGLPRSTAAVVRSADNVAGGGGPRWHVNTDVEVIRDDNGICVLTPGAGLLVATTTNNVVFTVNYFWRERLAEQSELSFP